MKTDFSSKFMEMMPKLSPSTLFGKAPPIDLSSLTHNLRELLDLPDLIIDYRSYNSFEKMRTLNLGPSPILDLIFIHPLWSPLILGLSKVDLGKLTSWIMLKDGKGQLPVSLRAGFYRYLLLQILEKIQKLPSFQDFTLQIGDMEEKMEEPCLLVDINLTFESQTVWLKLFIPESFHEKWISHFAGHAPHLHLTEKEKKKTISLQLVIETMEFSEKEFNELEVGDFIPLKTSNYDLKNDRLIVLLQYEQVPFFQAMIKHDQLEILEPLHHQEMQSALSLQLTEISLSLEQALSLKPRSILDIAVQPDQHISLIFKGKKIGTGELLYLGSTLGVQVGSL